MAATVAQSQGTPPGLHPLQTAALKAASSAQQGQGQHQQQQRGYDEEPFDISSGKLSVSDFVKVRTLGTGVPRR
jgi:hypothetical protein